MSAPSTEDVLDKHEPMEAVGGYIECGCGWPTHEQYEAGEHFAAHVIAEALPALLAEAKAEALEEAATGLAKRRDMGTACALLRDHAAQIRRGDA